MTFISPTIRICSEHWGGTFEGGTSRFGATARLRQEACLAADVVFLLCDYLCRAGWDVQCTVAQVFRAHSVGAVWMPGARSRARAFAEAELYVHPRVGSRTLPACREQPGIPRSERAPGSSHRSASAPSDAG